MTTLLRRVAVTRVFAFIGLLLLSGCATDDAKPRVHGRPGDTNTQIQAAMVAYIKNRTTDGVYHYYDPVESRMLHLKYDYLHAGVKRTGDFYLSCADFMDQDERIMDVDIFVIDDGGEFRVTQALLHKVDGAKRDYDLTND